MKGNGSNGKKSTWKGFYDFRPDKQERAAIRAAVLASDRAMAAIEEMGDKGYKVSLSYDNYHDCWLVSATGGKETGRNIGWTLTCRHSDLLVATTMAYWYCATACEWGEWPELKQPQLELEW